MTNKRKIKIQFEVRHASDPKAPTAAVARLFKTITENNQDADLDLIATVSEEPSAVNEQLETLIIDSLREELEAENAEATSQPRGPTVAEVGQPASDVSEEKSLARKLESMVKKGWWWSVGEAVEWAANLLG